MSQQPQGPGWWRASDGRWYPPQPSQPGPPYLHLKPRDLRLERLGDVALVTFMLDGLSTADGRQLPLQRRTLLFVWERETWKLAHLHASAASQP